MRKDLKSIGNIGENYAKEYLIKHAFAIIEENFHIWGGEIDIIAIKNNIFHIVEVKTSQSNIKPEDHINRKKMLKVAKTAEYYVNYKQKVISRDDKIYKNLSFRLDVILVNLNKDNSLKNIQFIQNR